MNSCTYHGLCAEKAPRIFFAYRLASFECNCAMVWLAAPTVRGRPIADHQWQASPQIIAVITSSACYRETFYFCERKLQRIWRGKNAVMWLCCDVVVLLCGCAAGEERENLCGLLRSGLAATPTVGWSSLQNRFKPVQVLSLFRFYVVQGSSASDSKPAGGARWPVAAS